MLKNKIQSIFNPEQFQGWTQKHSYFEGWYYKVVNQAENKAYGRIEESMNARIEVNLTDRKSGKTILNDIGRNAGLEVAGKIEEIRID